MKRLVKQLRVKMTGCARRDLECRNAMGADANRIVVGLHIAFNHGYAIAIAQRENGGFEQRGLAGTRR
jgi:hypothetical protein